jgi:hypothetical protein
LWISEKEITGERSLPLTSASTAKYLYSIRQ